MPPLTLRTPNIWRLTTPDGAAGIELPRAGEVHLWLLSLDQPLRPLAELYITLDMAEQVRAARFHFAHDRSRFIAGRGQLRAILAAYAGTAPRGISFAYGDAGKPYLAATAAGQPVQFNLSHCGGSALLAITRDDPVGVDIEAVRALPDAAEVAKAQFSPAEHAAWRQLPSDQRADGFFACWTRKEAVVKALGGGLSIPLDSFEVSVDPAGPARLISIDDGDAAHWSLWGGKVLTAHWVAIAIRHPTITVTLLRAGPQPLAGC